MKHINRALEENVMKTDARVSVSGDAIHPGPKMHNLDGGQRFNILPSPEKSFWILAKALYLLV